MKVEDKKVIAWLVLNIPIAWIIYEITKRFRADTAFNFVVAAFMGITSLGYQGLLVWLVNRMYGNSGNKKES